MKIYWTKYALTRGIAILDVQPTKWSKNTYCDSKMPPNLFSEVNKNEWFKTKDAALIQSEIMREKKIISIEKQKAKILNLDFENQMKETI